MNSLVAMTMWAMLGVVPALAQARQDAPAALPPAAGPIEIRAEEYGSLQEALDALPAAGGTVVIGPGTHAITQPLRLSRGDTRIVGAGSATRIVNHDTTGQPTLWIQPPDRAANPRQRIWRVEVAQLRLCGDPAAIDGRSGQAQSGDGIRAEGVNELLVQGVSIDHHGGHGVHLIDCYEDPRLIGAILTYNRQSGLEINACHDIVVSACQFEENQDAVRCFDSFNLTCGGNNIDDHLGHGIVIANTYGSVVAGNMIEECNGTAIRLDRDAYGITLSANVIAHNQAGGIHLLDAWGCAVSSNTFVLDRGDAVWIGPESGRIALSGNAFTNSAIGRGLTKRADDVADPLLQDHATGIRLEGTTQISVTGNVFGGLDTPAIAAVDGCKKLVVVGNVFDQPASEALDLSGAIEPVVHSNTEN